jgi:hypothetical protein
MWIFFFSTKIEKEQSLAGNLKTIHLASSCPVALHIKEII